MDIVFNDGDTERIALNSTVGIGWIVELTFTDGRTELVEFIRVDYDEVHDWLTLYGHPATLDDAGLHVHRTILAEHHLETITRLELR